MASKDLTHSILAAIGFAAASVTGDATGAVIDTSGYQSVAFVGLLGASASGTDVTISIEESDDGSTFTPASADDQHNETVEVGASEAARAFQLGYRGPKRYVRLAATHAGGSVALSAVAVLGHPTTLPSY